MTEAETRVHKDRGGGGEWGAEGPVPGSHSDQQAVIEVDDKRLTQPKKSLDPFDWVDHISLVNLSLAFESGYTGKLVNFPFQLCPICKDHVFEG